MSASGWKTWARRAGMIALAGAAAVAQGAPRELAVPGGVAWVKVGEVDAAVADLLPPPKVYFQDKRVLVHKREGAWYALVGLPLSLGPGEYALKVVAPGAGARTTQAGFTVTDKRYPEQRLVIKDTRKVTPGPEELARIQREQQIIDRVKHRWEEVAEVDLSFRLPANGPLSSRFGLKRFFNGQPRNPHAGLDVAIPGGTPVMAAAAGTVSNTGDYFFNGNTVFVDHGQGLVSMYCHLDRIDVKEGERLTAGQRLGLSGMTGRATGPHLHWSVILNGTMVDPELFISGR